MIELNVKANPRNVKKTTIEYEYFDEELYIKNRYKVEQSNAWMDAFVQSGIPIIKCL
jgi:hypothetical protein